MTTLINDGYLILGNGTDDMKVKCEKIITNWNWQTVIDHFSGSTGNGYDIDDDYLIFKVQGIYFDSHTKYDLFVGTLRTWHKAGTLELEMQRNANGDKIVYDGTNSKFDVLVAPGGLKGIEPLGAENLEVYTIKSIIFESI